METTQRKRRWHRLTAVLFEIVFVAILAASLGGGSAYAAEDTQSIQKNLLNGSFEEDQEWSANYEQLAQDDVPSWNTTAFQGKIELFRKNTGTYFNNVMLKPTDGDYAAELNADEESTLYQVVDTYDSSVYEWGLDHGARNGTDTMALIIGPNQDKAPSKPSKAGRDQFMQMVDWLIDQRLTSVKTSANAGLGEQITLYSKKFGTNGTFVDNQGNNAFSLTPSTIYTEEWHIWILSSNRAGDGVTVNPWTSFGSNAAEPGSGSGGLDLSKYYHYTVPAGQHKTLFGFVSVGYVDSPTTAEKAKTYGNFVDNINFTLYHPLSGSSTTHGSAIIMGSDGEVIGGEAGSDGGLTTYITDGEDLTVQAIVKKADAEVGCEFVGLYYTYRNDEGNLTTDFLQLAGNEINYREDLTEAEKDKKWIKSTNAEGDTIYTYYLKNLTSSVDLHFVFIKNPTITYDPNGGKTYIVEQGRGEAANVYTFKPNSEALPENSFIAPYVSHAAEGQNDGWKFMGWKLTGDTVAAEEIPSGVTPVNPDELGSLILPAVHTVACDYVIYNDAGKPQYFKIYANDAVTLTKTIQDEGSIVKGVVWADNNAEKAYANVHKGLTMVAQWRWRQAFVPQNHTGSVYEECEDGGTVEITSVTDTSDENYNAAYNINGGKAYFAEGNERVTVKATAKPGYVFEGWYEKVGEEDKLITTNATYSYEVATDSVKTCYARFSNTVTQTYIRQVMDVSDGQWKETADNTIGTLGRYSYTDALGTPVSSTATAGEGYKFVGWYDTAGNPVDSTMLTNNGATISYTTTGNQTYYARFMKNVAIKVTGESKTVTYNGSEHRISGYTVAYTWNRNGTTSNAKPDFLTLTGPDSNASCVTASGINAETYTMALSAGDFSVANSSEVYAYTLQVIPGKLTINKAARTISATDYNAPYDGAAHGITVNDTKTGDSVSYSTDGTTWTDTAPTYTDVQPETRIWVKVENPNYVTATADATITITKRPVTITVNNAEKFYHEADPAFSGGITSGSLVNESDLGTITYSRTNTESGVGIYQNVLIARYAPNDNYEVTVVPGTFTIKTTAVSGAAVTASGGSKPYDGTPLTVTATLTDEAAGYTIQYSTDGGTTWVDTAPSVTNVADGELTVSVKATQTGHTDLACAPVTINITQRPITITADSTEKFYDGTALTGSFTYTQPTSALPHEGLVSGQMITATMTGSQTKIGSAANTVSGAVIKNREQDVTGNYHITYVDGTLTVKAAEGITVSNTPAQTEVYAGNDVVWTVTVRNTDSHNAANGLTLTDELEGITITGPAGVDPASFSVPQDGMVEFTVKLSGAAAGTYVNHVSITQPKDDSTVVKLAEADAAAVTVRASSAHSSVNNRPAPPSTEEPYNRGYLDCTKSGVCPILPYTDADAKAWYHDGVHFCLENGLMIGYEDATFRPESGTTRAMLTMMLWRLNGSPVVNYALDFEDVEEGAWYTEAIRWAKAEGVAVGFGNGKFGPNDTLTREQMVTILYRYAQYKAGDVGIGEDTNILSYSDAATVSEYAVPAMQWACGSGVVIGKQDGNSLILDPRGSTTRAQMATMMMRYCAEIVK